MKKITWENILPKYHDYLVYEKEHSVYKANSYKKLLNCLSKELPLLFTFEQAREIVFQYKRKGRSPGYINHIITCLNSFIRYCQEYSIRQNDFTKELNKIRPKEDRTPDPNDLLSVEEVEILIKNPTNRPDPSSNLKNILGDAVKEHFAKVDAMYSLLYELLYKTAARSGEVVKLRKKDFNFSNHSLTFYETKTGDDRTVAIPPDMEEKLTLYMELLLDSSYLFIASTHKSDSAPLSQEMVNRTLKYRARLAGIKRPVHAHQLRHSSTTHMLVNGAPLSTVQAIVGHKRLATTQLYTHIMVDNQREVMLKYNPLIRTSIDTKLILGRVKDFVDSLQLRDDKRIRFSLEEKTNGLSFKIRVQTV